VHYHKVEHTGLVATSTMTRSVRLLRRPYLPPPPPPPLTTKMATKTAVAQVFSTLKNGGTLKDALDVVTGQTGIAVGALRTS